MSRPLFSPAGLRRPLLFMLPALILGLIAVYYTTRVLPDKTLFSNLHIDSSTTLALNSIHQTSSRNGIKEWTLDAASAKLLKHESKAVMEDVKISFFTESAKTVHLTSRMGILDTKTHDMTFSGHVIVLYEGYTLTTDKLHYEKKRHIMYSNDPTIITNGRSTIEADSFHTDLAEKRTTFQGNVKGNFDEKIDITNGLRSFPF